MVNVRMSWTALIVFAILSCQSTINRPKPIYCGYELTQHEYDLLRSRASLQKSPYDADSGWSIYNQFNDSIRANMPDSVEFEIFLSLLNKDEVSIDIYVPNNKEYFKNIGCTIMNTNFKIRVPEQRYMCLYTYTHPDGSGDIPLAIAIKRKR